MTIIDENVFGRYKVGMKGTHHWQLLMRMSGRGMKKEGGGNIIGNIDENVLKRCEEVRWDNGNHR